MVRCLILVLTGLLLSPAVLSGSKNVTSKNLGIELSLPSKQSDTSVICPKCEDIPKQAPFICSNKSCRYIACKKHYKDFQFCPQCQLPVCWPDEGTSAPKLFQPGPTFVQFDIISDWKERLGKIEVRCRDNTCEWTVLYGEDGSGKEAYDNHIPQCDQSLHECPNECGDVMQKKDLQVHASECPQRLQTCSTCKQGFKPSEDHSAQCALTLLGQVTGQEAVVKVFEAIQKQNQAKIEALTDQVKRLSLRSQSSGVIDLELTMPSPEEVAALTKKRYISSNPFMLDSQYDKRLRKIVICVDPKEVKEAEAESGKASDGDKPENRVLIYLSHVPGEYDDEIDWTQSIPVNITFLNKQENKNMGFSWVRYDRYHQRKPVPRWLDYITQGILPYQIMHKNHLHENKLSVRVHLPKSPLFASRSIALESKKILGFSKQIAPFLQASPAEFHFFIDKQTFNTKPFTHALGKTLGVYGVGNEKEKWLISFSCTNGGRPAILVKPAPSSTVVDDTEAIKVAIKRAGFDDLEIPAGTLKIRELLEKADNRIDALREKAPYTYFMDLNPDHAGGRDYYQIVIRFQGVNENSRFTVQQPSLDDIKHQGYAGILYQQSEDAKRITLLENENWQLNKDIKALKEQQSHREKQRVFLSQYPFGKTHMKFGTLENISTNCWVWTLPKAGVLLGCKEKAALALQSPSFSCNNSSFHVSFDLNHSGSADIFLVADSKLGGLTTKTTWRRGLNRYTLEVLKQNGDVFSDARAVVAVKDGNGLSSGTAWNAIEQSGYGRRSLVKPEHALGDDENIKIKISLEPRSF